MTTSMRVPSKAYLDEEMVDRICQYAMRHVCKHLNLESKKTMFQIEASSPLGMTAKDYPGVFLIRLVEEHETKGFQVQLAEVQAQYGRVKSSLIDLQQVEDTKVTQLEDEDIRVRIKVLESELEQVKHKLVLVVEENKELKNYVNA